MPFPESRRVIYDKNPLEQVIAQLRFPSILRIEAELPAAFQDKIRDDYPSFDAGEESLLPEGIPAEIRRMLGPLGASAARGYAFMSRDGIWRVNLNRDFVALTCTKYRHWGEFRTRLMTVLEHLMTVYKPSFYTRIGLRYRNLIDRGELGLTNVPWSELFQTHLAAELASEMADLVEHNSHQVVVALPNRHGTVRILHGLVGAAGANVYVIDNDFFSEERVEPQHAAEKLDQFNRYSGGLFRSFIKDKLDRAMGPTTGATA
jgi:uncharacterized protein (TIGR04255 family)